jgi:hypothetical protein
MRGLTAILLVAACGKSHRNPDPAPAPTGDPPPAVAPADAAPAIADAAVEPAPAPSAGTTCTGRWTARLNFDSNNRCAGAQVAAYTELDLRIAAGPQGWTASVTRPARLTVDQVEVDWQNSPPLCRAAVTTHDAGARIIVYLSRWKGTHASAHLELGDGDARCEANGLPAEAAFRPDPGGLPPPPPELAAYAGSYQLDLGLPTSFGCVRHPEARLERKQSFTLAIDRDNGDRLAATGFTWEPYQVTDDDHGHLLLQAHSPADPHADLNLLVTVDGTQVTGRVETVMNEADYDHPFCPWVTGKVTGTRTPAP